MIENNNHSVRWILSGISFAFGIIVTAVITNFIHNVIRFDTLLLNIVTILAFVTIGYILIFFVVGAGKRLNESIGRLKIELMDRMPQGRYYFVDDFDSEKVGNYQGRVYLELGKLAESAEESIYVVTPPTMGNDHNNLKEHPLRTKYFEAIEKSIEQKTRDGRKFTYIRILQISKERENLSFNDLMSNTVLTHCKRIVKLRKSSSMNLLRVDILKVATDRMTGFVIIDDRVLIVVIGGVDNDKRPYHAAIFVFEDNPILISEYKQHFTDLITSGSRITENFGTED